MQVRVERIHDLTDKVRSFTLQAENGGALPPFPAGAHIAVDVMLPGGLCAKRKYSILSDPAQSTHYEIAVLREPDGSGGSQYMHTRVRAGDILEVSEPVNHFPLATTAAHNLLLAGGIGITPVLSMLHVLNRMGASLELHYAARTPADHIYRETIETLAGHNACFYHSQGAGKQPLDINTVCANLNPGTHIYACGPPGFYTVLSDMVDADAISADNLHFESFGVKQQNGKDAIAVLSETGGTVLVRDDQPILKALTQCGIGVSYDCMRGECGMCAVGYRDGEVAHRDTCLSDDERRHRVCLCVSQIKSDTIVLAI